MWDQLLGNRDEIYIHTSNLNRMTTAIRTWNHPLMRPSQDQFNMNQTKQTTTKKKTITKLTIVDTGGKHK